MHAARCIHATDLHILQCIESAVHTMCCLMFLFPLLGVVVNRRSKLKLISVGVAKFFLFVFI